MGIKIEDMSKYVMEHYDRYSDIREVDNHDILSEVLNETIGKKYPEHDDIDKILERFHDSNLGVKEFSERDFDRYVEDEVMEGVLSCSHKNQWINFRCERILKEI